ncbi:MAG TPA: hypothetical protein VKE74_12095, partial [Gemmataceae bacterium]|nr:hypothetical protein [Gemmataceae bacterium]
METDAFKRLRSNFLKAPAQKWGAFLCSAAAAVCDLLLLILLYLFMDLLVWQGQVPSFTELPVAKKQQFADEWGKWDESDRAEAVRRLKLPADQAKAVVAGDKLEAGWDPQTWEHRWRAG